MKTIRTCLLLAGLATALAVTAAETPTAPPTNAQPVLPTATNAVAPGQPTPSPTAAAPVAATATAPAAATGAETPPTGGPSTTTPPPATAGNGTNGLYLNFRGAPLNLVLDYLSDAAGFVINKQADVRGTVDVWSKDPVTKDEAVELLNSVLKKNGFAVTRNGRILTIMSLDTAKTADLDVVVGNNPTNIVKSDEVITQIIPVSYANVNQLVANLQPLLPLSATLTANESANSLILVATKTDIRRMLSIIKALDSSIASVSSIKVFPLSNATAKDLANEITQLFSPQQSSQGGMPMNPRAQFFQMMRGGGPGGNAGASGSSGAVAAKVTAVADDASNSLIVSAPENLMTTITDMVQQLDQPVSDITELRVFHLKNADSVELANQFALLFPNDNNTANANQNRGFRFFRGPFGGAANQSTPSEREKKLGQVTAVADPRTSSLIVTASKTLMPQIADVVTELDASAGKSEVVSSFDLQHADPQDVYQVLQSLFNRNTTMRNNNANQNTMLGQNNPLTQRQVQSATTANGGGNNSFGGGNTRGAGGIGTLGR